MKNFRLTIEYDGSAYHGWQRQNEDKSVQGEIEAALTTMTGMPVILTGSGRTDAGVHALVQVANFRCDTNLAPEAFHNGLNSLLADDIVIKECVEADESFHSRFDAKTKTYIYRILNTPLPTAIGRQYAWHIRKKLDLDAMQIAATHIVGEHDFKSFEGTGSPRSHTTRTVLKAEFEKKDDSHIIFEIQANGFLRFMVRNIIGTLADVGLGKLTPEDFKNILLSKNRARASATAPPHGLFLMKVEY